MSKDEKKAIGVAVALILVVPHILWAAWVEKTLWWWFVVPLGVKPIGMAWAYGLTCVWSAMAFRLPKKDDSNDYGTLAKLLMAALGFGLMLFAGWIAHTFMVRP